MEMRNILGEELERLMREDRHIAILDADLAKACGTLSLHKTFPTRALNVGIAEQNMASVAAGMASYGMIPFIFTFASFASRRIADQAMISICYADNRVKIIGVDPGIASALNGGTHAALEDMGIYRTYPNMLLFEPSDGAQLKQAVRQIAYYNGPVYMRMFRADLPDIHGEDYVFDLLSADMLRAGWDVTIAASGIMAGEALEAARQLAAEGISAEVIDFHTLKPFDKAMLLKSVAKTGRLVTAENHHMTGGLYSASAEAMIGAGCAVPTACVGVEDVFAQVGKLAELKEIYGLTAHNIAEKARNIIGAPPAKGEHI